MLLQYYREKKDISQAQLAKVVGIPRLTVSKYETGERDFNKIALATGLKIAKALDVSIYDLIDPDIFSVEVAKPKRNKYETLRYFLENSGYGCGYRINNAFATGIGPGFIIGQYEHNSSGFEWMFHGDGTTPFVAGEKLVNDTIKDNYLKIIKEIGIEKIKRYNSD